MTVGTKTREKEKDRLKKKGKVLPSLIGREGANLVRMELKGRSHGDRWGKRTNPEERRRPPRRRNGTTNLRERPLGKERLVDSRRD